MAIDDLDYFVLLKGRVVVFPRGNLNDMNNNYKVPFK